MLTGTIKFFNKSKGFGFITSDTGGKEVFLPSATVTASGLKKIEPGQRISFQEEADVKGPKAIALTLLDEPVRSRPAAPKAAAVVLYFDPASSSLEAVRDALDAHGITPELVDYTAVPPAPEELKKWSLALSGSGVGLVRRSDPLFFALQLDDRFSSESDFWLAISQHPKLINGPILRMAGRLTICKSADDVRRFLGMETAAAKPKGISARLSALIRGVALPPEEEEEEVVVAEAPKPAVAKPVTAKPAREPAPKPVKAAAKPKAKAEPKAEKPKPAAKPVAKAKAKPAAKPKAAAPKKPAVKAKATKR